MVEYGVMTQLANFDKTKLIEANPWPINSSILVA